MASVRAATYPRRENYIRDLSRAMGKLHRLKQELSALEAGWLPRP